MAKGTIAEIHRLVNIDGLTVEQAVNQFYPGADIEHWKNILKNYDPNKKSKKNARRTRTYQSRRNWTASHILKTQALRQQESRTAATATLVERANSEETDGTESIAESILVTAGDNFTVLGVAR